LRLSDRVFSSPETAFGDEFESIFKTRLQEADEFYNSIIPSTLSEDARNIMRQAFAGMMWTKQFYYYPVGDWLNDEILPPDCPSRFISRSEVPNANVSLLAWASCFNDNASIRNSFQFWSYIVSTG
jgi:hypothetical protein